MTDDEIAEIRARHEVDNRYRDGWHPGAHDDRATLLAEVERLQGLLRTLSRDMAEEIERLRTGLHRVSLASQNSMSSKDECGRIARETLEAKG